MLTARSLVSLVVLVSWAAPSVSQAFPRQPVWGILSPEQVALVEEQGRLYAEERGIRKHSERATMLGFGGMAYGGALVVLGVLSMGMGGGLMLVAGSGIFYAGKTKFSKRDAGMTRLAEIDARQQEIEFRLREIEVRGRAGQTAGLGTSVPRGTGTRPLVPVHLQQPVEGAGTTR